jgi:RND superfamily putative drug exporter
MIHHTTNHHLFQLQTTRRFDERFDDAVRIAGAERARVWRLYLHAAGAVMVAVFLTFALSGPLPPKEMGIILGVAVLLDAALVRLLLLPVLLRLMGRHAWYLPRWARRILPNVTFGHA